MGKWPKTAPNGEKWTTAGHLWLENGINGLKPPLLAPEIFETGPNSPSSPRYGHFTVSALQQASLGHFGPKITKSAISRATRGVFTNRKNQEIERPNIEE